VLSRYENGQSRLCPVTHVAQECCKTLKMVSVDLVKAVLNCTVDVDDANNLIAVN